MVLISSFRRFLFQGILGRHYFGHLSKNSSTKPVDVSWKCKRPSESRYPKQAQFIENSVTTVARTLNKDIAIIRKEPHRTTRVNGKWIKYRNHITANFFTYSGKEGLSSHIYVSDDNQHLVEPTATKPNPKTWPIPEPGNKEKHRVINKPLKNDKSSKKSLRRRRAK